MTSTELADKTKAETPAQSGVSDHPGGLRRVLSLRDFRLLLAGSATSLLGDQFALIATPWLALELSDDPLALGFVLALEGIPRAVFMLVGGAVTDRFSPRQVMLGTDIARGALTSVMAAVVLVGAIEMWMLYAFALGFGLLSGLAIPAQNSIVPRLVDGDDLKSGNAVIMGMTQLAAFVGPTLAGAVIAASSSSITGVGIAFCINAITFAVSAITFVMMRHQRPLSAATTSPRLFHSIGSGFRQLWRDLTMRFVFVLLAAVNLFAVGPLLVGIPLLAHQRLAGALAFGVLMAGFAVGNLVGYVVAGTTGTPSSKTMARVVVGVLAGHGAVIATLGFVTNTVIGAGLLAGLGLGNGYLAISLFTWIQSRSPEEFLGRTMSMLTFASLGFVSMSQAAAGAVSRWDLDGLFLISGCLVMATTVWAAVNPNLRDFTDSLTAPRPTDHAMSRQSKARTNKPNEAEEQ